MQNDECRIKERPYVRVPDGTASLSSFCIHYSAFCIHLTASTDLKLIMFRMWFGTPRTFWCTRYALV
jgi:hypothetical protein